MSIKTIIGKLIYKSIAKHMPLSDSTLNFGSKKIRAFCGRLILDECGKNINIEKGAQFSSDITLGDNSGIGVNAIIASDVKIGNDVMMGPECMIFTRNHGMLDNGIPMWKQPFTEIKPVIIGNNCWIGARVTILPGVVLGDGCIIGAGSVVVSSFEPNSVICGNPAKFVKYRQKGEKN